MSVKVLGLVYTITTEGDMVEIPVEKKQEIIRDLDLLITKGWEYTGYKEFSKLIGRINFLITATKARSLKRFVSSHY